MQPLFTCERMALRNDLRHKKRVKTPKHGLAPPGRSLGSHYHKQIRGGQDFGAQRSFPVKTTLRPCTGHLDGSISTSAVVVTMIADEVRLARPIPSLRIGRGGHHDRHGRQRG